jgi:hypothetical protein
MDAPENLALRMTRLASSVANATGEKPPLRSRASASWQHEAGTVVAGRQVGLASVAATAGNSFLGTASERSNAHPSSVRNSR